MKTSSLSLPAAAVAMLTAVLFAVSTFAQAPQATQPQAGGPPSGARNFPAPTNLKVLPWHGGLFALARYTPEPLYFGEGQNLYEAVLKSPQRVKLEAESHLSALLGYILLEDDAEKRAAAVADLVERYHPPLNQ